MTTPLHLAAEFNNLNILKILIESGADVNAKIDNELSLHKVRDYDRIKKIMKANLDDGKTPLHFAVEAENENIVKVLIDAGADVNAMNKDEYTPLRLVPQSDDNVNILKLLIDAGSDVNSNSSLWNDGTLLHEAAESGKVNILKVLLESGADVNAKNSFENNTPLQLAASSRHNPNNLTIAKTLIDSGADIDAKNCVDNTPLHSSVLYKNFDFVRLLIDAGADLNSKSKSNITPLILSTYSNYKDISKLLVDSGANVNTRTEYGWSPIHGAARWENDYILKLAINAGVDVDELNEVKNTPLNEVALSSKNVINFQLLIEAGANVNSIDNRCHTPLIRVSKRLGDLKIFKLLIDAGSYVNECKSHYWNTCLWSLINNSTVEEINKEEILKYIIEYVDVNLTDDEEENVIKKILKPEPSLVKEFIFKIILEYLAKLKALNLHIDSILLETILLTSDYNNYFKECEQELKKAQNTKLDNCWVTLFNLVVDNEFKFVRYAGNKDLVENCRKCMKNFPIYGNYIESNLSAGIIGRKFFDYAANSLSYYLPIFNPTHLIIKDVLDILCKEDWEKLK